MRYKSDFHPSELLCPTSWQWYDFDTICQPLLEKYTFTPFAAELTQIREEVEQIWKQLKVEYLANFSTASSNNTTTSDNNNDISNNTTAASSTTTNNNTNNNTNTIKGVGSHNTSTNSTNTTTSITSTDTAASITTINTTNTTNTAINNTTTVANTTTTITTVANTTTMTAELLPPSLPVPIESTEYKQLISQLIEESNLFEPFYPPSCTDYKDYDITLLYLDINSPSGKLLSIANLKSSSKTWVEPILRNWVKNSGSDIATNFVIKFN